MEGTSSVADDLRTQAEAIIDEYVRPLVEADGGRIRLVDAAGKRVTVELSGVCLGCPGRPYTLEHVVQRARRSKLGDDVVVEARGATAE
jgi:Fe-S cluster biogenesis protein NfuA